MKHLTEQQLDKLKHSLLEMKSDLEEHFKEDNGSGLGESLRLSTGDLSTADNHPADEGTETFERSRDLAIDENLQHQLDQVNEALRRMETGQYGIDEISGEEIPYERLEALPYTTFTIDNSPEQRVPDSRPVEEEVMTLPPSGAGQHRQQDAGRFDDASAWKTLESYGNSDSPAMSAKRNVKSYNDMASDTTPDED
ncbi:conjugal transfer protein TraR [Paenibacillus pinistramenti]|uniref:conjugal transfer protein TraR n=1 Tax=Paenibacillus pinistramenti TaxID=1768003 RepID=UPI0011086662|nr:conjugal transfer protein TraR [Paenibacillus pinistramenti]